MRLVVCVALVASGCAFDPPPAPIVRTKVVTKIVPGPPVTEFKARTCRIKTLAETKDEFCKREKTCPLITTCGEAYYRYTHCREFERDGGVAGPMNGIPCQKLCGRTALEMAEKIRAEPPFSPPMKDGTEDCVPPK